MGVGFLTKDKEKEEETRLIMDKTREGQEETRMPPAVEV